MSKGKRERPSDITQDQVERWCQKRRIRLCKTWGECSCLWIEPQLYEVNPEDHFGENGEQTDHAMACANCAPECKHCGKRYVEDPSLPEPKDECDDSSCKEERGKDNDEDDEDEDEDE
jgi:hypothetical protein